MGEEFRQIFCLFKQLCRTQGADEPEQLLETVGLKFTESELQAIVRDLDANNDGNINFEEFCSTMTAKAQVDYSQAEIYHAFKAFQRNAPEGMIKVTDLREALKTHMHREMVDAEVDELVLHYEDCFVKLPGSNEEYFNFEDYINLMAPIGGFGAG